MTSYHQVLLRWMWYLDEEDDDNYDVDDDEQQLQ